LHSGIETALQYIDGDARKRFLAGGRKRGLFYVIGEIEPQGEALIGEGFATMASVHEATGKPAIVALDTGNLKPVAEALRAKYPQTAFIICADDDFRTEGNPGRAKAAEAAEAIGSTLPTRSFLASGTRSGPISMIFTRLRASMPCAVASTRLLERKHYAHRGFVTSGRITPRMMEYIGAKRLKTALSSSA
jgi:hypothetical protein